MGAAISLLIHLLNHSPSFNDAILVALMCKISDEVCPKWPIPQILTLLEKFVPILPIVPTLNLLYKSVKVDHKKLLADMNPYRYHKKPRLGTVVELLRIINLLDWRLYDVTLPFIVLHRSVDVVTTLMSVGSYTTRLKARIRRFGFKEG